MKTLAGVRVRHREEGGVSAVEVCLIERNLRRVDLIEPNESITFDGAESLGAKRLMFPYRWIDQSLNRRPCDQDAVSMATKETAGSLEA